MATNLRARFNPRARVGRDRVLPPDRFPSHGFNPRARVGRDSIMYLYGEWTRYGFNPRARVGRDCLQALR